MRAERVTADEALELYLHAPTHALGRLADEIPPRLHPDRPSLTSSIGT